MTTLNVPHYAELARRQIANRRIPLDEFREELKSYLDNVRLELREERRINPDCSEADFEADVAKTAVIFETVWHGDATSYSDSDAGWSKAVTAPTNKPRSITEAA